MKIGAYALPESNTAAVFVAPMAGITDRPFRCLARRYGAALAVSEMVSARPELRSSYAAPRSPRESLLAGIWSSFTLGAGLGVWSLHRFGLHCLIGPIVLLMFIVGLDMLHPIAEMHEVDHGRDDYELKRFGIDPGILPATVRVFRIKAHGRRRRKAPDLGRLPEKVGADIRALILMFEEGLHLDENNMVGLRNATATLRERGCELVLCVTESRLFMQIQGGPAGTMLGGANLCADPEFAVARAVEITQPYSRQNVA